MSITPNLQPQAASRLVAEILWRDLDVEATPDAPLGPRTWYGAGGRAELLAAPRSLIALQTLTMRCYEQAIPVRVLGSGANLLVAEDGVDGVVILLDHPVFQQAQWSVASHHSLTRLHAGADLMGLIQESARRGLAGLSQLAGIPATVGGAIVMNAGGTYGDTAQSLHSIQLLTPDGITRTIPKADLECGYRKTVLPPGIVLAGDFALSPGDPDQIRDHIKEVFAYKSRTQPMADRSAGCMFKNPIDPKAGPTTAQRQSAGQLIDLAGLKGTVLRSAFVSERHGNFIGLHAGGSTNDVLALAHAVQLRVLDRFGIRLEREVVVWSQRGEVL